MNNYQKYRESNLAGKRKYHQRMKHDPEYRAKRAAVRRKRRRIPDATRPMPVVCECCGRAPGLHGLVRDHDHDTGAFRGWVCGKCNTGLGLIGDSLDAVERVKAYLLRALFT